MEHFDFDNKEVLEKNKELLEKLYKYDKNEYQRKNN